MKVIWQLTITSKECKKWLGHILGMNLKEIDWQDICEIYEELYDEDIEDSFANCLDSNAVADQDFYYYLENYYLFDGRDKNDMIKSLKVFERQNKIESLL